MKLNPPSCQGGSSESCFCQNSPSVHLKGLIVRREQVEFLGVELGVDAAVEDIDVGGHRQG